MLSPDKYKAFISYSHADEKWAGWLHRALESYRIPKHLLVKEGETEKAAAGLAPIFRDRDELASSPDLSQKINEALQGSENLIVICSPSAARSRWVGEEIALFKKMGRSENVFCLIVDGDPSVPGGERDCFPAPLRHRYDSAGTYLDDSAEPVAADARKQGDGKQTARLKLIAGLLGVGLDVLRRREMQRRQHRMLGVTFASLLAAALTTVLAFNAMVARKEAEQRRLQAEDLLEFMVGDLREKLTPLGKLDLLEAVGKKAMDYFTAVDIENLSENELVHQTQVITQIGEIRFEQLEYESALQSFMDAYERSAALHSKRPGDQQSLFNRGQAEFWVGYVHWKAGDLARAGTWLRRYLDSSIALSLQDPYNLDWQREVAYGHHNLGALARETDELDLAKKHFSLVLEQYAYIGKAGGGELKMETADALSYLGDIAAMQGSLVLAGEYYQKSLLQYRALSQVNEDDAGTQRMLGNALYLLGENYAFMGDISFADQLLGDSVKIFESLVRSDPSNLAWVSDGLEASTVMAYLRYADGDWMAARNQIRGILRELDVLERGGHVDQHVHRLIARAQTLQAALDAHSGNPESAITALETAEQHLWGVVSRADPGQLDRGKLASVHLLQAETHKSLGNSTEAQSSASEAKALLGISIPDSGTNYLLDPWVRYLVFAGQKEEADKLKGALEARAYRPLIPWPD